MKPHEEFLELCALSTSGELDEQEQEKLNEHLVGCDECREALRQFEGVVDVGIPMLLPHLSGAGKTGSFNKESHLTFAHRNGHRRAPADWNLAWLFLPVTVLLVVALSIYLFQIGRKSGIDATRVTDNSADVRVNALEEELSDGGHEREVLEGQIAERDGTISSLRREIGAESAALAAMKVSQAKLKQSLEARDEANRGASEESTLLALEVEQALGTLDKTEAELESVRHDRAKDQGRVADLNTQIDALSAQLHEDAVTIDKQTQLLAHDRDIRELMGARDLYIAEIYDVAHNGKTQKSFGRIFYTKEKSLVFYAFDLERQPGVKEASAFQAWGRSGQGNVLNLGIFYQDSAAKKRWVLKFDNPRELSEIDAVFVTVEPKGGSPKPTGKPLLFASLRIGPNHP